MIYAVKFIYNDGKDLLCNVAEENIGSFFQNLNQKQVFYDEKNNVGFWTDIATVRYIEMRKVQNNGVPHAEATPEISNSEIQIDSFVPGAEA